MNILIAPNAMKGVLSATEFSNAIEEGLCKSGNFNIDKQAVADGGDGTAAVLATLLKARFLPCKTVDPLGREIISGFFINDNGVALIEMASASGLQLLRPDEYSAVNASSFGTGLLIQKAIDSGAKTILLAVGGSATVDAGMGALMALGTFFFDAHKILEHPSGAEMGNVVDVNFSVTKKSTEGVEFIILSDVTNPMLGKNGAVPVFAPQKGASFSDLKLLEKNMSLFAGVIYQTTGKDVSSIPGGGAAGAIAATFLAVLNARIVDGANYILEQTNFFQRAKTADLIITGEGKLDSTSLAGKATGAILNYGMKIDKPVILFCGQNEIADFSGFDQVVSLVNSGCSIDYACDNAYKLIVQKASELGHTLKRR